MTIVVTALLVLGVAATWLGTAAMLRLSALARLHAVSFVTVAAGGAVTAAAWCADGPSPRTAKVLLIWIVLLLSGALSSHVTGRAIHARGGERR